MTTKKRNTSTSSSQKPQRTTNDSLRWIAGLLLLFVGIYIGVSVFSSYFCWAEDQSGLVNVEERVNFNIEPANPCGWTGARLGKWLVDDSFGVFGLIVPIILMIIGLAIIRIKPLKINQTILSLVFIMVLGSLSLGAALSHEWSACASTGWGGMFGIECSNVLKMNIGGFGTLIVLLVGWILTGVFINRNFINTVNSAGNAMVDKSEKLVDMMRQKVVHEDEKMAQVQEPAQPIVEREEMPVEETVEREEMAQMPEVEPLEVSRSAMEEAAREFDIERTQPEPTPQPEQPVQTADPQPVEQPETQEESPFEEINIKGREAGRLVMGRGGLIEESVPVVDRKPAEREEDNPFTEITIPKKTTKPEEQSSLEDVARTIVAEHTLEEQSQTEAQPVIHDEASDAAPLETEAGTQEQAQQGEELPEIELIHRPTATQPQSEGIVVDVEAPEAKLMDEAKIPTDSYDPLKDLENYRKPSVGLLEDYKFDTEVSDEEIYENKTNIEETLKNFGIPIQRIKATVGPTVTLYEIVQGQGVKISKIQGLENDIAQSLKALGIRIIAPIPGKGTIGIEVPNRDKQIVSMYSAIRSQRFQESKAALPVVIGRTIQNENYVFDLAKMPHLLVAGATGQGKSVGLNAIITSLLYRKHPAQLKFVLIDPKMVEFSLYSKIERHFLAKMESEDEAIITDPKKAVYTLNSLCVEMDNRLELCKKAGTRNIGEYNQKFINRRLNPQKGHRYLPYIVVIVDEFADLIMTAREVEAPVMRLAQKARAIGIHLIIATQRPDVKVITGGIKANFPARMAFRVMQMIDSRTIIDQPGANQLIGRGDMLFSKDGELTRIQCALVETDEVERVVDYISRQQSYSSAYALPDYSPESGEGSTDGGQDTAPMKYDVLFAEVAREAVANGQISTSMIQRNYEVGFNRAGRIMMQLERSGIVGRQQGAKPREILFYDSPSLEAKLQDLGVS